MKIHILKLLLFIFLSLFFIIPFTCADEAKKMELPRLIPREVLFENPVNTSARISPDGSRLAYLAPSEKGVMNVWVRPVGEEKADMITHEKHRGIRRFFWAKDGSGILYLQDSDGDENFHVYHSDLKTGLTRDLTPFQSIKAVNVIVGQKELLVGLNIRHPQLFDIYRIDLKIGAVVPDTENPGDVIWLSDTEWVADSNLVIRAARAMDIRNGSIKLRVRDSKDQPWRIIKTWPEDSSIFDGFVLGFADNGSALYVFSSEESNTERILKIDILTGEVLEVTASDERCSPWIEEIFVHPVTGKIQAVVFDYQKPEWKVLDPDLVDDFERLERYARGHFSVVSRDNLDSKWVVTYEKDDGPTSTYIYDRKLRKLEFAFDDRPELKKFSLARMEPIIIEARDGLRLPSYLTLPVGIKPEKLPMVLYVHGGPTARDEWGFEPYVQLFANRGCAVLQVNYRGSVGFGKDFRSAGDRQIGVGSMQHDLTDAVKWAIKLGIADPERVAIYGGSYGGYAALAGLAFTPELYAAGAEGCGPSNIKTMIESIPAYYGPLKKLFIRIFGDAENDVEYNRKVSPLFHVEDIRAPLLIGQGENDPRCNIRESDQIVKAMREKGLDVTYVVYSDEGHGFVRPENKLDFIGRVEEFFGRHLGLRYQPHKKIDSSSGKLR